MFSSRDLSSAPTARLDCYLGRQAGRSAGRAQQWPIAFAERLDADVL